MWTDTLVNFEMLRIGTEVKRWSHGAPLPLRYAEHDDVNEGLAALESLDGLLSVGSEV